MLLKTLYSNIHHCRVVLDDYYRKGLSNSTHISESRHNYYFQLTEVLNFNLRSEKDGGPKSNSSKVITTLASNNSNKGRDEVAIIACIGLVARVSQNRKSTWKSEISLEIRNQFGNQKSTWKSEINLEIRNQSLEIRNQVRNHGDLKSRTLFSEVSYPSVGIDRHARGSWTKLRVLY